MKNKQTNERKREKKMDEITIEKIKKEEKAISLVALTVTIIVLLILAGVAITLSIGENGIFKRAGQAADTWENATKNEEKEMNSVVDIIDSLNGGGREVLLPYLSVV